jgi:trk system potassium uptake protein TrkA
MALKDLRVPKVVAKAASDNAGKVLERVGADKIVYPERDRAMRLARTLVARTVIDYMQVSPDSGIIELQVPESFVGKTLSETRMRNTHRLTVLEIRHKDEKGALQSVTAPGGDHIMLEGDTLVVFGSEEDLRQFEKRTS